MTLESLGKFPPAVSLLKRPRKSAKMEAGHPRNKNAKNGTHLKAREVPTTKETQIPVKTTP